MLTERYERLPYSGTPNINTDYRILQCVITVNFIEEMSIYCIVFDCRVVNFASEFTLYVEVD